MTMNMKIKNENGIEYTNNDGNETEHETDYVNEHEMTIERQCN